MAPIGPVKVPGYVDDTGGHGEPSDTLARNGDVDNVVEWTGRTVLPTTIIGNLVVTVTMTVEPTSPLRSK